MKTKTISALVAIMGMTLLAVNAFAWRPSRYHAADSYGYDYYQKYYYPTHPNYSSPSYSSPNYSTPSYSTPNYLQPSVVMPQSGVAAPPVPDPMAPVGDPSGHITLWNAADSGGDIEFTLRGETDSLHPGETRTMKNTHRWIIGFSTGGSGAHLRYTLSPGVYKFKSTEQAWNLFKTSDQPPTPLASDAGNPTASQPQLESRLP